VAGSSVVTALTHEPAVLTGVGPAQASWLGTTTVAGKPAAGPSVTWYDDPARWKVELAAGGPAAWPRVSAAGAARAPAVRVPSTRVTRVALGADGSVRFHVTRLGTPVLVKVSYFPNWSATGARGPWRVTPNLMVVVPTSHDVTLTYGSTPANDLGLACAVAGVLALVALGAAPVVRRRRRRAGSGSPPPPPPTTGTTPPAPQVAGIADR